MNISKMEEYAKKNNIPIMEKEGIEFLKDYIKKNNIINILEIGSAIGYSSIQMASCNSNIYITTIERDETRYNEALKNIKEANLENQIEDAYNLDFNFKFDLIFIDAAKAQYTNFFLKFKDNLSENGVIVSDNLKFHGLVDSNWDNLSRNVRGLVRKLKSYNEFLEDNKEFETTFYDIGDGIAVSKKVDYKNNL